MDMGMGLLGRPDILHKLQSRFTLEFTWNGQQIPPIAVEASRPELEVDEAQIDYLNARTWIPTKAYFQPITVKFYDLAGDYLVNLYSWLATVYNFTDPVKLQMASFRQDYAGRGTLRMWDGCGGEIERWSMEDMWPKNVKWGEVSMKSNEPSMVEVTFRFSSVQYLNSCGSQPRSFCRPCRGGNGGGGPLPG